MLYPNILHPMTGTEYRGQWEGEWQGWAYPRHYTLVWFAGTYLASPIGNVEMGDQWIRWLGSERVRRGNEDTRKAVSEGGAPRAIDD